MSYWMYAIDDQGKTIEYKGDSGSLSQALWFDSVRKLQVENNAKPRVGVSMSVGSSYARSYTRQDYWTTTPVTKIIKEWEEDGRLNVIFKTKNSTYHWKN